MASRRRKKRAAPAGVGALKKRLQRLERQMLDFAELHDAVMGGVNEGVYDWNVEKDTIRITEAQMQRIGAALTPLMN
jgi:hypothetical protein